MICQVDVKYLEWLKRNPGINPSKQLLKAELGLADREWNDIRKFNKWLEGEFETFYLLMEGQGKLKQMETAKAWSYAMNMFEEDRGVAPRWYNRGVKAWVKASFREHENLNDRNLMQNLYFANHSMGKMAVFHQRPSFATKMMIHSALSLMRQLGVGIGRLASRSEDDYGGNKLANDDKNILTDGSDKLTKELDNDDRFQKANGEFENFYKNTVEEINKSKRGSVAARINDINANADRLGYEREDFLEGLMVYFSARGVHSEIMNEDVIFSRQDNMFA